MLSTGLTIQKNAERLVNWVDDIIVSLDGPELLHDRIRNIPGAFRKMKEGIESIRAIDPSFRITGRSVIHRLNFRQWPEIILAAKDIGLDSISFLPADVSSTAFNRELAWTGDRQQEIVLEETELEEMQKIIQRILDEFRDEFRNRFIVEPPQKFQKIYDYYAAYYGLNPFPL